METPISPVDMEVTLGGPAPYSNRFYVTVGPVVKIAFAEQEAGLPPRFRAAVTLAHQDAIGLAQLLTELLRPVKEQLDAIEASQKKGA
jgi:hypothetical protein